MIGWSLGRESAKRGLCRHNYAYISAWIFRFQVVLMVVEMIWKLLMVVERCG